MYTLKIKDKAALCFAKEDGTFSVHLEYIALLFKRFLTLFLKLDNTFVNITEFRMTLNSFILIR